MSQIEKPCPHSHRFKTKCSVEKDMHTPVKEQYYGKTLCCTYQDPSPWIIKCLYVTHISMLSPLPILHYSFPKLVGAEVHCHSISDNRDWLLSLPAKGTWSVAGFFWLSWLCQRTNFVKMQPFLDPSGNSETDPKIPILKTWISNKENPYQNMT